MAGAGGREHELLFNGDEFQLGKMQNILEVDNGDA